MINEHVRLATVRRLALVLSANPIEYLHLTRLATRALQAPVAYIALLDEPQQQYLSAIGLPSDWTTGSSAALAAAICRAISATGRPQTMIDARHQPGLQRDPAGPAADSLAHCGVPISIDGGLVVGALCVADRVPRAWSGEDYALLGDLATALEREFELREREARCRILLDQQTEQALRASEERFRALSAASPIGIFQTDTAGRCVYGNPQLQTILALTPDQITGSDWARRVHPDDVKRIVAEWRECRHSGRGMANEYRIVWPDGSIRWARGQAVPLRSDSGALIGYVGTVEDITERHAIEEALRSSEERFRVAIDAIPYPLVMYDAELRIQFINAPGVALTDHGEAHIIGRTDEELFDPELTRHYLPTLRRCAALRSTESTECVFKRPKGERTFLLTYVPLLDEQGQLRQILGIAYDISERSRAEAQRIALERKLLETQKLESLGVLAGGIAHDFNNLLGAILGNAELALLDLPHDSETYECVAQIRLATQRAAELTQQMLAYSGRGRFVVQAVDLNALIREMHHLLSASIGRTATVHYQLAAPLPPLMADATQLRQVVMNLLTNAAEAIAEPGGVITVTTRLLEAARDELAAGERAAESLIALSVSDTGSGMTPATLAKIFDPFFTTKFTGRGLGLAAVQGIVRGHHGRLEVQSAPGCGTTFTIMLPAAPIAAAVDGPLAPGEAGALGAAHGTVLVVDDEPGVRTIAARTLERFGFKVLLASDGREGVELFRSAAATISYVLLDLTMPQLSGAQALHAMRAISPAVRVIVMSGYNEQEVLGRFGDAVPDGFLHKPFLPDELHAALLSAGQPLVH